MTQCTRPLALDTVQITAFLDGEEDPALAEHLRLCAFCRARAQEIATTNSQMHALLHRSNCPPAVDLQDYKFDLLTQQETETLAAHIRTCSHCTHDLFQLEEFVLSMQIVPEIAPAPPTDPSPFDRLHFLVASLLTPANSGMASALGGVRGTSDELLYQANGVHIGIAVEPDKDQPDRRLLLGSLLGQDEEGWQVDLWRAGNLIASAAVDDLGSFGVPGLAPGSYALIVGNAQLKVLIPSLNVA